MATSVAGYAARTTKVVTTNSITGIAGLFSSSGVTLTGNRVYSNSAGSGGGGVSIAGSDSVELDGNTIYSNAAKLGGGMYVARSDGAALTGNVILSNTVTEGGGGIYLRDDRLATLTNNVIVENQLDSPGCGAGVSVENSEARMLHTTIARNRGGVGGVCALGGGSVALTNTILVSHATGIQVYGSNTATLEGTLWGGGGWANAEDWAGTGAISTGTVDMRGDPAFVDPDGWDYHIGPGSAAINAGVEAGVETDIDGDPRPPGRPPDIGADERELRVYLPAVLRD